MDVDLDYKQVYDYLRAPLECEYIWNYTINWCTDSYNSNTGYNDTVVFRVYKSNNNLYVESSWIQDEDGKPIETFQRIIQLAVTEENIVGNDHSYTGLNLAEFASLLNVLCYFKESLIKGVK